MIVFDEMPLVSLLDGSGRIDRLRYPNLASLARTSTWYPNATTASDSSKLAIPSILDGQTPVVGRPATSRGHPRNIFTLLHARGYHLEVQEEATSLCSYRGCRRRHDAHYFLSRNRLGRFKQYVRGIGNPATPTLYYKHALLPHVPWIFTPSLRRYDENVLGPITGLNSSDRSVFDKTLVQQSWQRHLLQVGAADSLLGRVIARMKQTGIYDRAAFVIMADHGVSFRVGATDRRTIVPANTFDIAPIPLFMKAPRQRRGRIDRSLVRTYDVLPTLAHQIGLRLPRGLSGRATTNAKVRRRGRVSVLSRAPIHRISFSRGGLLSGRRGAVRRKLGVFGSGFRSLYDFGRNRPLRARFLSSLSVAGRGRLGATLNDRQAYKQVRKRSNFVPIHVTGRIFGGRRGARRDIAVGVNGRIWGVTRSVHILGNPAEYYSVLISEDVLLEGQNKIEVFSVDRNGGRFLLRRLR
ncbi:MAG: sulfatase-like hydrolase/transferase [Thermoleophilaceae bacterium]